MNLFLSHRLIVSSRHPYVDLYVGQELMELITSSTMISLPSNLKLAG